MEIVQDRQIFKNEKMSAHTSFRIGGRANRLVQATTQVAVLKTLCECACKNERIFLSVVGQIRFFLHEKLTPPFCNTQIMTSTSRMIRSCVRRV